MGLVSSAPSRMHLLMNFLFVSAWCHASNAPQALAMEGGGFRAQSVGAGFMTGMLAFVGKQRGLASPTFESTELLSRFDTISTNSGSSWFFSSMAYSTDFKALLQQMAASPAHSAPIYRAGYTKKWLLATNVDEKHFNFFGTAARAIAKLLFGTGDEDDIYMITYFLATGLTWNRFAEVLLNSTAAIPPSAPLGSPPAGSWSHGKSWLVCHTVMTPPANPGKFKGRLFQAKLSFPYVGYQVRSTNSSFPVYVPAVFSTTFGAGVSGTAPHRYVADSAVETVQSVEYLATECPLFDEFQISTTSIAPILSSHAYVADAGQLPISKVRSSCLLNWSV